MKVVIGLGNPGHKYEGTRHNIGFMVIDYLAAAPGVNGFRRRFESQVAEAVEGSEQVLLVKPETFMNLSGRAVRQVIDFYKLSVQDLLVICDDLALPVGKLRAKARGSHGGQNGLRNIQEHLGTAEYARLRVGIGSPNEHETAIDYVLGRIKPSERAVLENAVAEAARGALLWVREGIDVCMNRVNGGPEKEKVRKPKLERTDGDPKKPEVGEK